MDSSRVVRTTLIVVGAVAVIVGAVFSGQGAGLIPGSFMTGDRTWLTVGVVVAFAGVVLIVIGLGRSRGGRRDG